MLFVFWFLVCFFFFKQKTAYEMRISDWSSDVCSSDLAAKLVEHLIGHHGRGDGGVEAVGLAQHRNLNQQIAFGLIVGGQPCLLVADQDEGRRGIARLLIVEIGREAGSDQHGFARSQRSEEHTSELQSLMRISYAVFCLKKK